MDQQLIKAYRFFRQHDGRAVNCIELARAELAAEANGWSFAWEYDDHPWDADDDCPAPSEVLGCVLSDAAGNVLASLWGIGDPSSADRRYVEAELALEASAHINRPCEASANLQRATGRACTLRSGAYTRTDSRCFPVR